MRKILLDIGVVAVGIICLGVLMDVLSVGLRLTLFGAKLLMVPVEALVLLYVLKHFFFILKNK